MIYAYVYLEITNKEPLAQYREVAGAALSWIKDPELQDVHALRNASGESSIHLLA